MLQDMIHFSRPIDADFSFVDINHLIQEVLKTIHPRAEQNQILWFPIWRRPSLDPGRSYQAYSGLT